MDEEALEPWHRDDIESWIAENKTAQEFNCAHRSLAAVPWNVLATKFPLLRGVNAEHNQLTEVGTELGELAGLLALNLATTPSRRYPHNWATVGNCAR